jgi:lysophospholipase L1-like esterase
LNLQAIGQMQQIARQGNAQFLLALTPLRRQVDGTPPRDYEAKARARLQEFAASEGIVYLDFLPLFQQWQPAPSLYRDHIHLSPQGNRLVSEKLGQYVTKLSQELE